MEVKEIIENLKYNNERKFQKESIIEARKNKEEVTEELLKELEKVADNIGEYAKKDDYMLLLYAIFLLAEFREKRAYPIIIKIITNKNQKEVDYLLGDVITGHLRKILASTNDGNIDVLYNIITNLEINEYIRGEAFKTLEILQKYNILKQEQIINFIEKALDNELKDDNTIVITDIVTYIAENKIYNKIGLVQKLYQEHRVNESMIGGYDDFIDEIYGNREPLEEKDMVEDTIEELSWWACFDKNDDKDIDFNKMMKDLMAFENTQVKKEMKEIKETKEIGRNDLCPCGSGKKYKKCCMNKKELEVITPADLYIQKSLQGYPKEELKKFYDEEAVAIDEKLYQVLKHKAVPLWIDRNYTEEMRRNTKSMNEAIELIKEKCEKDKINTLEEFDKSIAIHYNFEQIIYGYFKILDNTKNVYLETIQDKKREFLLQVIDIFDIKEEDKKRYINYMIDECIKEEYYSEAIEEIKKFKVEMPEIEKFLNVKISQAYLEDYRSIEEVLKPLEETIQKFGLDEELEIRRMELYYDYILQNYYEDEEDDEENEIELCQKLWQFVKDFVKTRNIVLEKEYDEKQEAEYYYSNIIYRIDNVYKNNSAKYIDQRMKFLDEAMNLMELGQESKEILVGGLVDTYCDMHKEDDAIKLIDEFIIDFPNSSNAILIKSDIYSGKDNPDYESAIRIVEEALKNDEIDCEYNLIAKLALLYDECGNEEKAREYQELAVSKGEWDLPF